MTLEDPTRTPGWDDALRDLGDPPFFFAAAWARVLRASYGFTPLYLTVRRANRLSGCLPLMELRAWPTGRRGVALPFSDECAPMSQDWEQARALINRAIALGRERKWRSFEMHGGLELYQPVAGGEPSFVSHTVDLRPSLEGVEGAFDGAIRRGIRTARREQVQVEFSDTIEGMRGYYRLHCLNRKRHGLPPQPWRFFENIHHHIIRERSGFVSLARHGGRTIAGAVFFHAGRQAIYKYGASDYRFQRLRANNLVMWEAMVRLAKLGVEKLSLGRSSLWNEGLRRFKRGWGSSDYNLWYMKYDYRKGSLVPTSDDAAGWHNAVFARLPIFLLCQIGRLLYRYRS